MALSKSLTKGENGDLLIKVRVKDDQFLRKDGNNIISNLFLTVSEAVLGG
jgi:DnaJ-class molecular chaperone